MNGRTNPTADELKRIMLENGGTYHHYQRSHTKYVIASNLPDVKIRSNITKNIIKPEWITDCLKANKLLDSSYYLLHTNQNSMQRKITFKQVESKTEEKDNFSLNLDALNQKLQSPSTDEKTGTAVDKNFLQDFLANSRLHHIATLGSGFKFYVTELRKKHNGEFPEREIIKEKLTKQNEMPKEDIIMHIDMDCFFVSVGLKKYPHLKGFPLAVTHSKGKNEHMSEDFMSFSEIASCSYEARAKGLKNGMFVGQALKLCPDLKTIPYEFDEYRKTAYNLYNTVAKYTLDIEAVSCDELYADLTSMIKNCNVDFMDFVTHIRQEIFEQTGCTCSVGIGANRLQARMATKKAKPNNQYELISKDVLEYMKDIKIRELPGVGYSTSFTLDKLNLQYCRQIHDMPLQELQNHFGKKFGETLLQMSKGLDDKKLNFEQVRKSVSVDVNYGIRFNDYDEVKPFFKQVCDELSKRLDEIEKKGKCLTLKIMMRARNASAESIKFMGHGEAEKVSKSVQLPSSTSDSNIMFKSAVNLLLSLNIPAHDLRGIGLQVSKLDDEKEEKNKGKLLEMFKKMIENPETKGNVSRIKSEPIPIKSTKISPQKRKTRTLKRVASNSNMTSVADMFTAKKTFKKRKMIDPDVLSELPPEIVEEILREYDLEDDDIESYNNDASVSATTSIESIPEVNESLNDGNLFKTDSWRSMIKAWIDETDEPNVETRDTICCDLIQLIRVKNLELPFLIMRFLNRIIDDSAKDGWKKFYNYSFTILQEAMRSTFGSRLNVPKKFENFKGYVDQT